MLAFERQGQPIEKGKNNNAYGSNRKKAWNVSHV